MRLLHAAAAGDISRVRLKTDPLPDVFQQMCELADTPRSLAVWLMFKYQEFEQLVNSGLNPADYEPLYHPDTFQLDYACRSMLLKFQDFDIGIDRELAAFNKWRASEENCRTINETFRQRWSGASDKLFPHRVEEVLHLAKRKIRSVLGSVDTDFIRSHCRFGPGADLTTRGDNTSGYHKFSTDGSCTPWILPLYDDLFSNEESDYRGEPPHRATYVTESRLSFVPKNAKTDRSICVEPRWNVFLQLGIGRLIQKRLLRCGIDIRSQERNQNAASRAYVDGLATVDLSAASDSVALNLVIELFAETADPMWLELLLKSRCPRTSYKGQSFRLEKISSMGNGYTFPLETLIFYAIAHACMQLSGDSARIRQDLCVYGDDIIVPQTSSALLIEALSHFGFLPNKEKTYVTGNFYESCGKDFYCGKEVRPFFVKEKVRTVADAFTLANQVAAYAAAYVAMPGFASRKVWHIRECIIRRIPKHLRCFGPPEAGNGVLHSSFDVARPSRARYGWEGFEVRCHVAKPKRKLGFNYHGHLYNKLLSDVDCRNTVVTRSDVVYSMRVVYVPKYTDVILV